MRKILYLSVLLLVVGCKLPESSSSTSTKGKVPDPRPPQADKTAQLTWAAATGVVQGYKVEASGDGVTFFEIGTLGPTDLGVNVTGLYGNVKYYFRVRAFNQGSNGAYNATVAITL